LAEPSAKPALYDWVKHWDREITAAEKARETFNGQAEKVLRKYLDQRDAGAERDAQASKWNYFWAMQQTRLAMLFGQTPHTDVDRRFADADDDEARVAGEMLERILNEDLQDANDGGAAAMRHSLFDHELVDLGQARVVYEADFEAAERPPAVDGAEPEAEAPKGDDEPAETLTDERVCIEWTHWKDFLWSPGAKVWGQVRWVAFGCELPRDVLVQKFGEKIGKAVPLDHRKGSGAQKDDPDPRKRAYVYEIWSKEHGKCFWWVKGFGVLLRGPEAPPIRVKGFWPCPEPMIQNATTSALMPKPSYALCQDLYAELDMLASRTTLLTEAISVKGVYDGTCEALKALLQRAGKNEMVPADNWAMFAEKGGIKGAVDWFPLEMVVNALVSLQERAQVVKANLQEINGHSDVLRGEALDAGTTATDARRATRFASVRLQSAQDRFARFCSDLQRIKAEVVCEMFEPERLIQRSNILKTADGQNMQLVQAAVQLLKSGVSDYRIEIRPESVSLEDFSAQKSEAMELLDGMTKFLVAAGPLAKELPGSMPFLLKLLQGVLSKVRAARWAEGILDPAIAQAEAAAQQPQQPGQDPEQSKQQTVQMKAQADIEREKLKLQADLIKGQAEVRNQAAIQQQQTEANVAEEEAKLRLKVQAEGQRALIAPKPAPGKGATR
jgi:hypothetical protein